VARGKGFAQELAFLTKFYLKPVFQSLIVCWLLIGGCLADESRGQPGFVGLYLAPKNPANVSVYENLKEARVLEATVEFLNFHFVLPRDVRICFAEVGSVNAFYVADDHAVYMGYELFRHLVKLFHDPNDYKGAAGKVSGAFMFVLFHEIGHALIGELELPTVGPEEDVVDEFATLLLIELGPVGQESILSAAAWFSSNAQGREHTPFWDEHSLDMQRFYTIFTFLYATDPQRYASRAKDLGISDRRLALARRDYPKKEAAWRILLEPHLRSRSRFFQSHASRQLTRSPGCFAEGLDGARTEPSQGRHGETPSQRFSGRRHQRWHHSSVRVYAPTQPGLHVRAKRDQLLQLSCPSGTLLVPRDLF
jgi:hypothetical protein